MQNLYEVYVLHGAETFHVRTHNLGDNCHCTTASNLLTYYGSYFPQIFVETELRPT